VPGAGLELELDRVGRVRHCTLLGGLQSEPVESMDNLQRHLWRREVA